MVLLLLACAAPTPPLAWLDAGAVDAGLHLDGDARSFPIALDEATRIQGVEIDPIAGEIAWISYADGVEVDLLDVGSDVDPDVVEVEGDEEDLRALAGELDLELRRQGTWFLVGDDALAKLTEAAPEEVDAAWPVMVEAGTTGRTSTFDFDTNEVVGALNAPASAAGDSRLQGIGAYAGMRNAGLDESTWVEAQAALHAARIPFVGLYTCSTGPLLLAADGTWSEDGAFDLHLGEWTVDGDTVLLEGTEGVERLHVTDRRLDGDTRTCPRPE